MPYTFPNQRTVCVHREPAKKDFLGIKNENWQAAARNLRPHALLLYLYLAANADNYVLALSPAAVRQSIGMARSTYHDQVQVLIDKGYLVPANGNSFDFYETPHFNNTQTQNAVSVVGLNSVENPSAANDVEQNGHSVLKEDIQINNTPNTPNNEPINIRDGLEIGVIQKPPIKEVVIPRPKAEGKSRPSKKEGFTF